MLSLKGEIIMKRIRIVEGAKVTPHRRIAYVYAKKYSRSKKIIKRRTRRR